MTAAAALVAALVPGSALGAPAPCTGPITYAGLNDLGWPIWVGTSGADTIDCRAAKTSIEVHGGGGNDTIWAPDVWAWAAGGPGSDTMYAGRQGSVLYLAGLDSPDTDVDGANTAYGGPGPDMVFGAGGSDRIFGGAGDDRELYGGYGNDVLDGGPGNDYIAGGAGDDLIIASAGTDSIYGCGAICATSDEWHPELGDLSGHDVVDYRAAPAPVNLNRSTRSAVVKGWAKHWIGDDLDEFLGTPFKDAMSGAAAADVFDGFGGNDTLSGGAGDDMLTGGPGTDVLTGGVGKDTCLTGERLRTCEVT
jgi:Ca2+-binding RTX toxin-like protein